LYKNVAISSKPTGVLVA